MKKLSLFIVALTIAMASCEPNIEEPTVVTKSVTEITESTAKIVGQVAADGGAEVTERGVCWNTEGTPTILDYRVKDAEVGVGTFTSNLSDLEANTTYYVRAYATNAGGTSYGEEKSFTTREMATPEDSEKPNNPETPTVVTKSVTEITESTAKIVGQVAADGGAEVTERGVCWNTEGTPTILDYRVKDAEVGVGTFTSNLSDLEANTTYYVRAYATNEVGTSYGEEKSFTTREMATPEDSEKPDNPELPEGVISCTEALAICEATGTTSTTETYTIRGYVTEFKETFNTQYGNATYWMADKQNGGKVLLAYRVRPVKTSDKAVKVNDYVEVVGTLVNYYGNTPEVNAGGTYTIITTVDSETPDTPNPDNPETPDTPNPDNPETPDTPNPDNPETPDDPETPKYEWVDLGLSVKWATCNVGASSPGEYGNYYAWGEIEPKDDYYTNSTVTFGLSISELKSRGYIDSDGNLTSSYDAATANWGKEWRMPTSDEIKELSNKCRETWAVLNGVPGYYLTGPNGKSIFLPAAGSRKDLELFSLGASGYYWSSTPNNVDNSDDGTAGGRYADNLSFSTKYLYKSENWRSYGMSIRPVLVE